MRMAAKELVFISQIKRDGTGVDILTSIQNEELQNDTIDKWYELNRLSITNKTYIASGFNSYVVKIR
jgi:hypothetical protein